MHTSISPGNGPTGGRYFPHERLRAYELSRSAVQFVAARRAKLRGLPGNAGPQLERAVVGAHTNLCAGASAEGADRRRHFRIALFEGGEAGGCTDAALDFGAFCEAESSPRWTARARAREGC